MCGRLLFVSCLLLLAGTKSENVAGKARAMCAIANLQNVDCSPLLINKDLSCVIKYYPTNSEECSLLDVSKYSESKYNLGDVSLKPYMWDYKNEHFYNYTVFNATFSNAKWTRLMFRFEAEKGEKAQENKNHCREIIISGSDSDEILIPFLNYDCNWSDQDRRYENESYIFEYAAENKDYNDYGRFIFKVPSIKSVFGANSIPFIYIDLTNKKTLDLHIVPVDKYHSSVYSIELCIEREENSEAKCKERENVTIDTKEFIHSYTPHCSGWHYFRVTHSSCVNNCSSVFTPKIYFETQNIIYTILWNVLIIFGIFGSCFTIWWLVIRTRKFKPKILIIHPYADKSHSKVINIMCKYFQMEFNWDVSWNKDIESTPHSDPYIWCSEGVMNSNSVIYIEKPSYISENTSNDIGSIHMHLGEIFFKIHKSNKKKNMKFYNIMLETHSLDKISSDVKDFNTYYLPTEWMSFMHSLKRHSWLQRLLCKVPSLRESLIGRELAKVFDQLGN
ncbi:uncharacterized protein LOC143911485 [Arctopsyche grandis]|uniref:uncharacterized protein LOC143911485 n=1 Tax=Arctopsyche grandis TaxID=121162 RepID=UPI00406D996D